MKITLAIEGANCENSAGHTVNLCQGEGWGESLGARYVATYCQLAECGWGIGGGTPSSASSAIISVIEQFTY